MKIFTFASATFLSLVFLSLLILPDFSVGKNVTPTFAPHIRNKNGTSTNWSGYAVETSLTSPQSGAVSDVKGSWTLPAVTCSGTNTYSATWLGIDGYSDNTVEQTGTEQDCVNGSPLYSAWYEMYPHPSFTIGAISPKPGDTMSAEVKFTGNGFFVLSLADITNGQSFTIKQKSNGRRQSAEWIMEAPYSGGVLPLSNFGTQNFTNSSLTLNGVSGGINGVGGQYDPIIMENSSTDIKASPSALSLDGKSFSVQWFNSN